MGAEGEISPADARRLLALAREARWTFPSSSGRPIGPDGCDPRIEELLAARESLAPAARLLIEQGDAEAVTEFAAGAWRVWILAREIAPGREFLSLALDQDQPAPTRSRALALYGDGLLAFWGGALEDSRTRSEAALLAAQASGDREALALGYLGLSRVALEEGDARSARDHAERAYDQAARVDEALSQGPLHMLAQATRLDGDDSVELFRRSLALNRRLADDRMVAVELHNLGHVEIRQGEIDAAERHFAELARTQPVEDAYAAAMALLNGAAVAFGRGAYAQAEDELTQAEATLAEEGIEPAPDDRSELEWLRGKLADKGG